MCACSNLNVLPFSYNILQKLFLPSATGQKKSKKEISMFIPEKRRTVEKQMLPQYLSFTLTETSYSPVILIPSTGMSGSA